MSQINRFSIIILVLALSLRVFAYVYTGDWNNPWQHMPCEEITIGMHIAEGRGFACPFASTADDALRLKSAHTAPGYPILLGACFSIFGKSNYVIACRIAQLAGCLFGAITIFILARVAYREFGVIAGGVTGILGAIIPPLVHRSYYLWNTSIVMFAVGVFVCLSRSKAFSHISFSHIIIGLLAGIFSLFNPVVAPFYFLCIILIAYQKTDVIKRIQYIILAFMMWSIVITPWTIRNYIAFNKLVPIRHNYGLEFWIGQLPDGNGSPPSCLKRPQCYRHPSMDPRETALINKMGESDYYSMKMQEGVRLVKEDKCGFIRRTINKIVFYWFGELSCSPLDNISGMQKVIMAIIKFAVQLSIIILAVIGIRKDANRCAAFAGIALLLLVPIPYYLSHVMDIYRIPILLLLVFWAGNGVQYLMCKYNFIPERFLSKMELC